MEIQLIVELLLGAFALIAAIMGFLAKREVKAGREELSAGIADAKINTNHGLTPGEYLEMIGELKTGQSAMSAEMRGMILSLDKAIAENRVAHKSIHRDINGLEKKAASAEVDRRRLESRLTVVEAEAQL